MTSSLEELQNDLIMMDLLFCGLVPAQEDELDEDLETDGSEGRF